MINAARPRRPGLLSRCARPPLLLGCCVLTFVALPLLGEEQPKKADKAQPAPMLRDPYRDHYQKYQPAFMSFTKDPAWQRPKKEMELSTEKSFYTQNMIKEDQRAYALVTAGVQKEKDGQFREALKIYQQLFDRILFKNPDIQFRVSEYGIFVPVAQYVQRRILQFPDEDLKYYRTLYDAKAKEAFEQSRRKHSLVGLTEVANTMLATSYGGRALLELGKAALDSGYYLSALEFLKTVRDFIPDKELRTPELGMQIAYCQKMLGFKEGKAKTTRDAFSGNSALTKQQLGHLQQIVQKASYQRSGPFAQLASKPNLSADDYVAFRPTEDPQALKKPVWQHELPGTRNDYYVYTHPTVTGNSVIYRHKNIVYARSILNGELRWTNELGGRAVWQNWRDRIFPMESLIVTNGVVVTPLYKVGASLVALDEVTGQMRWAYGPMVASTPREARMRFEAAPAAGPRTIYAPYVLDNIEGDTHTDSEYGILALDSATGRVIWDRTLCRLLPGKFAGGFASRVRNRIRSYTSPPLYHEGTLYYNSNAGAIAALDARSGRVKWMMRYPYTKEIHDQTRSIGGFARYTPIKMNTPLLWYNQRALLVENRLYVMPVDTRFAFCIDRRDGTVQWCRRKGYSYKSNGRPHWAEAGATHFVGPMSDGTLVYVYSGRSRVVQLVDPKTGKTLWESGDIVQKDPHPVMDVSFGFHRWTPITMNHRGIITSARPFLTADDKLYITGFHINGVGAQAVGVGPGGPQKVSAQISHLACVDLKQRKVVAQRRYYNGSLLSHADNIIRNTAPHVIKTLESLPHKSPNVKAQIKSLKTVAADTTPTNSHPYFMPHARVTFERYGQPFELRIGPRKIEMVYARDNVLAKLKTREDPDAVFAQAELAIADNQLDTAAAQLTQCLNTISSEDLDFRATINQQLYRVHKRLARRAVLEGVAEDEVKHGMGMSRTRSTLAEEIETLFALSEGLARKGDTAAAASRLQSIINVYGHHEYPLSSISALQSRELLETANEVLAGYRKMAAASTLKEPLQETIQLLSKGLPLYQSTVSPLKKDLTIRAGELAAMRLRIIQGQDKSFREALAAKAAQAFQGSTEEEQLHLILRFPGTPAAQKYLNGQFDAFAQKGTDAGRKRLWQLADAARVGGLAIPQAHRAHSLAPTAQNKEAPFSVAQKVRKHTFKDEHVTHRIVLQRRGERATHPELAFLGARIRKRLDNKFALRCLDLNTGETKWDVENLRLRGTGQEPGFFTAFVYRDLVAVHGLYDVLAFNLADGKLRWRYRVPFDFEIKHANLSGDLLVVAGKAETVALYLPTPIKSGEVAWQVQEKGDLYAAPYFHGERYISVRKFPFSATVRYRATGKLIGRLQLPDLSLHTQHPLLDDGPRAVPMAHDKRMLFLTDGWYFLAVDVERMCIAWKRLIELNDATRDPPMRFAVRGPYLTVLKQNYDQKAVYMFSSETGAQLWKTDPKNPKSPAPMHSILVDGEQVYGIELYPGQGFYLVGRNAKSGNLLFRQKVEGYQSKPKVTLDPERYGDHIIVRVQDKQDFEIKAFDLTQKGKPVFTLKQKGVGPFGVPGRASATVQAGHPVLLTSKELGF